MIAYMNFCFKNSCASTTDWLCSWVNAKMEQSYLKGSRRGKLPWSRTPPKWSSPSNYRPITCLLMMWKILIVQKMKKYITRLYVADYFRKNREDGAREQENRLHKKFLKWVKMKPWQQNGRWYGLKYLDNRISENLQNIL